MKIKLPDPIMAIDGEVELQLTPMEAKLLVLLINNQGILMTHERLAYELWGEADEYLSKEMTRPLCSRLRKKIGAGRIETIWGRGYIYP